MNNYFLVMIKPDIALDEKVSNLVIDMINKKKFVIVNKVTKKLTLPIVKKFYQEHKDKPFFKDLCSFISSDKSILLMMEDMSESGEDDILRFREFTGHTNPLEAADGTLRKLFGTNIDRNGIHCSDSKKNGEIEVTLLKKLFEASAEDVAIPSGDSESTTPDVFAVIEVLGHQYIVEEDKYILVNKIGEDREIVFDNKSEESKSVLLIHKKKTTFLKEGELKNASVVCENLGEVKGEKVVTLKFRRRKDSSTKTGHRTIFNKLLVKSINIK